jgi:UDPglucose--hexose-1-phosphate uridylyltransferase
MPELRRDPVTGRWVVFSPERMRRPVEVIIMRPEATGADANPFLPGNEKHTPAEVYAVRAAGTLPNTPGWKVRVVPNRFPALRVEGDLGREGVGFFDRMNGIGAHEVVIETPHPEEDLELQSLHDLVEVLKAWRSRLADLSRDSRFRYIQIFKNVGAMAGASLPHPHSQIVALPVTPPLIREELAAAQRHYLQKERNLFEDILLYEIKARERMVYENAGFGAFCPFASRFSFETCLMPKKQQASFSMCDDHDLVLLADALRRVLLACRHGLREPSYNLVLHTAPVRRAVPGYWQTIDADFRWHLEILPRLTGVAGFEMATGCFINTMLPEDAAAVLRKVEFER